MTEDFKLFFDTPSSIDSNFDVMAKKNPSRLYCFKCGKTGIVIRFDSKLRKYIVLYRGFNPGNDGFPENKDYMSWKQWLITSSLKQATNAYLNLIEVCITTASPVCLLTLDFGDV